jgi:steroid 5-alpha reductase family enzyme
VLVVGGSHVKVNSNKRRLKVALVIDVVESVAACTQRCELVDVRWGCAMRVVTLTGIPLGTRGPADVLGPRRFCGL